MYVQGKESILYLKYNAIWTPISCETSNGLSETAEMIPTTTRDDKGWESSSVGVQSYSISFTGQVTIFDFGVNLTYFKVKEIKRDGKLIEWQRRTANRIIESGMCHISDLSDSFETDGIATFDATLKGVGKPRMIDNANPNAVIVDYDDEALVNEINNAILTNP